MPDGEANRPNASPFCTSVPGLLTGLAALITAVIGGYAIWHHPGPTAFLFVNPSTIQKGKSSTLTWQTTEADAVNIEELGPRPPNGSQLVTPDSSITYHLTATGVGGTQKATAEILVTAPAPETKVANGNATNGHPPHSSRNVLSGDWRGTVQVPSQPIVLHINLGGVSTDFYGNQTNVTVNGNDVQFTIPSVGASFHGTLQDMTINGFLSQGMTTLPLSLTKTGGGGGGGNGDWQGQLIFPPLPVVFHIDVDGASTCDSPSQPNANGMHVDVTVTGNNVQFNVPSVLATFYGTLHGTQIDGTFSQHGLNVPLTLVEN